MLLAFLILIVFSLGMAYAAYNDITRMKIPNKVCLYMVGTFLFFVPFVWGQWAETGNAWATFGEHVMVGVGIFMFTFLLFLTGSFGAGDAKLLAATSLWWTTPELVIFLCYTVIAGGVAGLFMLFGRRFVPISVLTMPWIQPMLSRKGNIPYGLAMAIGGLLTLPKSSIFMSAAGIG